MKIALLILVLFTSNLVSAAETKTESRKPNASGMSLSRAEENLENLKLNGYSVCILEIVEKMDAVTGAYLDDEVFCDGEYVFGGLAYERMEDITGKVSSLWLKTMFKKNFKLITANQTEGHNGSKTQPRIVTRFRYYFTK